MMVMCAVKLERASNFTMHLALVTMLFTLYTDRCVCVLCYLCAMLVYLMTSYCQKIKMKYQH